MARVQVINQVEKEWEGSWKLCLQWGRYFFDDGNMEYGYRFIWRDPDGNLHPTRGQASIPSLSVAEELINEARKLGWGDYDRTTIDV